MSALDEITELTWRAELDQKSEITVRIPVIETAIEAALSAPDENYLDYLVRERDVADRESDGLKDRISDMKTIATDVLWEIENNDAFDVEAIKQNLRELLNR